jgi:Ca2+-binding EF-hand superfamily protein
MKKPETPPTTPLTAEEQERAAKFDKLDDAKAGKLTRDYYTTHQSDAAAAAERFDKYDSDKDGFVSREEYILKGKMTKN